VALLGLLGLAACGKTEHTPAAVVESYFRFLAVDPLRTLPLLTPGFQRRHALRVVTQAEAQAWVSRRESASQADLEPAEPALSIDRLQLGWLSVQRRPEFARLARESARSVLDVRENGDEAEVITRIEPRNGPPFEQHFQLVREATGSTWRIDAVEQRGVGYANAAAAFAAYPNERARRALETLTRAHTGAAPK
jgi:hypothetical protein